MLVKTGLPRKKEKQVDDSGGPWMEVRAHSSGGRVKETISVTVGRKRKVSLSKSDNGEECWTCGHKGYFKDKCPFIQCHFCKVLGHKIAECLVLPTRMKSPEVPVKSHMPVQEKSANMSVTTAEQNSRGKQLLPRLVCSKLDNGVMKEGKTRVNLEDRHLRPDIKDSTGNRKNPQGATGREEKQTNPFAPNIR